MSSSRTLRRRAVSLTGLLVAVVLGTVLFLPVVALIVLVDLVRGRVRLPLARLVSLGLCWAWLESAGLGDARRPKSWRCACGSSCREGSCRDPG